MRRAIAIPAIGASVLFAATSTTGEAAANLPAVTATVCTPGVWTQEPANVLPAMVSGGFNDVTVVSPTLAWAVGDYGNGSRYGSLIEKWTGGSSWSVVGTGTPSVDLWAVTSFGASDAWAVGEVESVGIELPLVTHWNGSTWTHTTLPKVGRTDQLFDVSGSSGSDIWAIGTYRVGATPHPLLEHYNGTAWSLVSIPTSQGPTAYGFAILDLGPDLVFASGQSDIDPFPAQLWEWTGTSWHRQPTPAGEGALTGSSASDLWTPSYISGPDLEHYNGTKWSQVGPSNTNVQLSDLAEGSSGEASLWSVGFVDNKTTNALTTYIAKNGIRVSSSVPRTLGTLGGVGTGSGLVFAVGGSTPTSGHAEPLVYESCD
jgi:hypothetical protein